MKDILFSNSQSEKVIKMGFLIQTGVVIYEITQKGIKIWGGSGGGTPDMRLDVADAHHPEAHIHVGDSSVNLSHALGDFLLGVLPYDHFEKQNNHYYSDKKIRDYVIYYKGREYDLIQNHDFLIIDSFSKKLGGLERRLKSL